MSQHDRNDELHRPVDLPSYVKRPKWKGYKGSMDDYIDALELYIDNLEALLAAKSEWRPIESAPKNGTCYLATNGGKYAVLNEPPGFAKGYWEKFGKQWAGYAEMKFEPTHWMPLLELPEK